MLQLFLLVLLLGPQARPPSKCSLSGTVADSVTGVPLSKVYISLEPLEHDRTHTAVTMSDARGHFELVDLDPGSYRLHAKRNGYLEMAYRARRPGSAGGVIRFEAGQALNGIRLEAVPAAVIAGTVRDSDGEPLEGAHVTLARFTYEYGRPRIEGCDSTETDDRGEYRFRGLPAGDYYAGAESNSHGWNEVDHSSNAVPGERSVPTLYPGVPDVAMAAPVEVHAGSRVTGIDVTLLRSRVFRVSGRITNAPAAQRLNIALRDQRNAGMRDYDLRTTTKNAAGDFEFRGVPPGSYQLAVSSELLHGFAAITVSGSDIEGVRVPLAPGAEVRLHVDAEPKERLDLAGFNYFLTADGRSGFSAMPQQTIDRLTLRSVPPDHYFLRLSGSLLRRFYVRTARAGKSDVLSDGLKIEGPGIVDVEVVLAADGATVEGLVTDTDGHAVSGATILLAPGRRSRGDLFKTTTSNQNGHFEIAAIAPGEYKLFAWEDVEPEIWNDPAFLKRYEKRGRETTLKSRSRAVVSVPLAVHPDPE